MARQLRFVSIFGLLLTSMVFGESDWRPIANGAGLFFKTEQRNGSQPTCIVRLREDKKLRRTTSDLSITYSFQQAKRSQNYSARFDARDTDTIYLDGCEQVASIVATKVQRW